MVIEQLQEALQAYEKKKKEKEAKDRWTTP